MIQKLQKIVDGAVVESVDEWEAAVWHFLHHVRIPSRELLTRNEERAKRYVEEVLECSALDVILCVVGQQLNMDIESHPLWKRETEKLQTMHIKAAEVCQYFYLQDFLTQLKNHLVQRGLTEPEQVQE